ncbi:hypothetical protein KBC75_01500 [Candidatus Shapirobacteria bacterium]|nr:hypothetical protein [Candidatus Shapirobacteria bacterium]
MNLLETNTADILGVNVVERNSVKITTVRFRTNIEPKRDSVTIGRTLTETEQEIIDRHKQEKAKPLFNFHGRTSSPEAIEASRAVYSVVMSLRDESARNRGEL